MKNSRGAVLAALTLLAVSLADASAAQVERRIIPRPEWASADDDEEALLELVEIRVAGNPVVLGQAFEADENWLKHMTLTVKNVSRKPIVALGVGGGLLQGVDEELPIHASFQYGVGWNWGKMFDPEKERPEGAALKPGGTVELSYEHVARMTREVLAKEGEGAFRKLEFMSPAVQFADGTFEDSARMRF